jgi:hypothetical protein
MMRTIECSLITRSLKNGLGFPARMPLSLNQMNFNSPFRNLLKTLLLVASLAVPSVVVRAATADADAAKTNAATATPTAAETRADAVANSVVKVFSTMRYPDLYKPWIKDAPSDATGSGVVIEGKRILTCRPRGPLRQPGADTGQSGR